MRIELKQVIFPQSKSKIKAGDGKAEGRYKFFTSSPIQSKFVDEANYDKPSLIFGTGGNASVHFCDEPFSTSTDCLVMYGRSKTELETIYNYLKSNIGILENGFKGAGLKHISKDYVVMEFYGNLVKTRNVEREGNDENKNNYVCRFCDSPPNLCRMR
ncbi:MAG: hypothetical protein J6A06_08465 [Fibrobacteraceae bacterium]|nr:hypothetical protein [Fibrobacteraceae bacterium]